LDLKGIGRTRLAGTPSVSDLISASGSRYDGQGKEGGEKLIGVLGFRRARRRHGQGVVIGGDAMFPGAGEFVDDDQRVMAESIVWSSSSLASQSDEEAWPEGPRCQVTMDC
jgi:hypothetical protein